jgi:serine/threonine protein kinase
MLQAEQVLQERYQLQQQLGQNAGRQTWLAADLSESPAQLVIVKLLAFNPQMHWDELKLFEREAQVLKYLNHPRIPKYRDYFCVDRQIGDGLPWFGLVQDYIPGHSLQQLLNQSKRFTEKQTQKIARNVLEILIYLHELSPPVFHRDIKPSNLILGNDEQVHLVDFGAVQDRATAEGVTFTVVGTSGYTPPEQLWGRAVPASDLYALGTTLIHLLTGTTPADLPQRRMRIQFSDRVSLNPNFTHWLEQLAEPVPERRFSTARQALYALQAGRDSDAKASRWVGNSVRYDRLAGLALLQLVVVSVAFAQTLPSVLDRFNSSIQREVSNNVEELTLLQQPDYLRKDAFSSSFMDLGLETIPLTENNYPTPATAKIALQQGTSCNDKLNTDVGKVCVPTKLNHFNTDEMALSDIWCEANSADTTPAIAPSDRNGMPGCSPQTTNLSR